MCVQVKSCLPQLITGLASPNKDLQNPCLPETRAGAGPEGGGPTPTAPLRGGEHPLTPRPAALPPTRLEAEWHYRLCNPFAYVSE